MKTIKYNGIELTLLLEGASNWDYYLTYGSKANNKPWVMAIAKENSGCSDSVFGSIKYFKSYISEKGLTLDENYKVVKGVKKNA